MNPIKITAIAHPNIAFIKYWGNQNNQLRIPVNDSLSMNLETLFTETTVEIDHSISQDNIDINGNHADAHSSMRISLFLSAIRKNARHQEFANISTINNFPSGSGIASSASGFAALALAASMAYGLKLSEKDLSRLARLGSGSACRSIPTGFVEWHTGTSDADSFAASIAKPDYWDIVDLIAIVDASHKKTGSTEGHHLAPTSPLQLSRINDTPRRLEHCKRAVLERDFTSLGEIVEQDCMMMHSVMMTSTPGLLYWQPSTLEIIHKVIWMRKHGMQVYFTIDAGPNVHILTEAKNQSEVEKELQTIESIQSFITSKPGGAAYISG